MTTLATPTDYRKVSMTGYTGHIPSKNDRCGETQGQTLREILYVKGKHMFDKPRIPSY